MITIKKETVQKVMDYLVEHDEEIINKLNDELAKGTQNLCLGYNLEWSDSFDKKNGSLVFITPDRAARGKSFDHSEIQGQLIGLKTVYKICKE